MVDTPTHLQLEQTTTGDVWEEQAVSFCVHLEAYLVPLPDADNWCSTYSVELKWCLTYLVIIYTNKQRE